MNEVKRNEPRISEQARVRKVVVFLNTAGYRIIKAGPGLDPGSGMTTLYTISCVFLAKARIQLGYDVITLYSH